MKRAPAKLPPLCEPAIGDRVATRFDGTTAYGRVKEKFLEWFHVELEDGGTMVKLNASEVWKVRDLRPARAARTHFVAEVKHADPS